VTQDRLTKSARGKACTIRLPGICNGDPETTVACHYRLMDISGIGLKSPSIMIAYGCSACHSYVDKYKADYIQLCLAHGVFRTQIQLLEQGLIKVVDRRKV
jgi:hypothetical protein